MEELYTRYFKGDLTPSEEEEVLNSIRSSRTELQKFRLCELQRSQEKSLDEKDKVIIDAIISSHNLEVRRKRLRVFRRAGSFAAAFVAVALLSIFTVQKIRDSRPNICVIEVSEGSVVHQTLPDGSVVWINAGSTLTYMSDFGVKNRNLTLTGEAYFEVSRNEKLPFVIKASGCDFTVLGTKFNIYAYKGESEVQAALMEGSLRFDAPEASVIMHPGELATYVNDESSAKRYIRKEPVNASDYNSWIDGCIRYDAISLPMLVNRLARMYKADIVLEARKNLGKQFRVSFDPNEKLETIFKAVAVILPIDVECIDGTYYIKDTKNLL